VSDSDLGPAVPEEKLRLLFGLLFSSPEPVNLDRIREVLYPSSTAPTESTESEGGAEAVAAAEDTPESAAERADHPERFSPKQHLEALERWMQERDLPLVLHVVGRAWRLLTSEEVAEDLSSVRQIVHKDRLGPAALEVLSLVAYRQPILKADIDAVRGVKSGPHLRHLLDMRLVRILGRADLPGRPFLYGTTREFLDRFGLQDLKDLPEATRLASPAEAPPAALRPDSAAHSSSAGPESEAEIDTEAAKIAVEQENQPKTV
jgi:segregation and condensation protein B